MTWLIAAAAVLLLGNTTPALAQVPLARSALRAGTVTGTVLDAASGQPLGRAEVVLEPASSPPVPLSLRERGNEREGMAPTGSRAVVTDDAGRYRFDGVAAGVYRLHVRHIGYRPTTVEIDLRDTGPLRVSIGLEVQPILLEAMPVEALASPYALTARNGGERGRVDAERSRQERYLTGDVRGLTGADAMEAVTLGETDLLRAFQRLPGVSTRDDFTAHLWTRGARWSETRVYFDGLPLFNPVHAAGAFSAIHPDAVGAAFFHPGVRSAALGEGAAAALEISSRTAADTSWSGAAEVSVISARATVDRRFAGGRAGLMLAARRSYVDVVTAALADSGGRVPYAFHDVGARLDLPVGRRAVLEASALWEQDVLRGSLPDILSRNRGHWGNALGRVSLVTPVGRWGLRHSLGASRFVTHLKLVAGDTSRTDPSHEPVDNTITYVVAGSEVSPVASPDAWRAGYELVRQSLDYAGGAPTPYARTAALGGLYRGIDSLGTPGEFRLAGTLRLLAVWGEGRWRLLERLTAQAGARVELGRPVRNAGGFRVAPRVMVRYQPVAGRLSFTAGWGRSFQYAQTIAPTGPRIGPDLHVTDVWLLAGDSVPAVRADVATLGAEYWIAGGWLGAVNAYARRATGVTEPDPTPGGLRPSRPPFVSATNRARGVELSLRRLVGRVTVSLAYSQVRSETQARAFTYPASFERRHVYDATTMVRVAPGLRLGGAVTKASGAPFTRYYSARYSAAPCDTVLPGCLLNPGDIPYSVEEPNTGRAPPYATVDLLADWTWARRRWELGAYLQLRNAFNWRNANTYLGSVAYCTLPRSPGTVIPRPGICDRFDRGLPLLPLAGVRVAF